MRAGPEGARAAALLALAAALAAPAAAARERPEIAFVHVEANVGGASGGHAAVRLGDQVYHYQSGPGGILELAREDWALFRFRYAVLQNRPLHAAYVALSPQAFRGARDGFARALLEQRRMLGTREDARLDLALLEALAGLRPGVPSPGAGLLDPGRAGAPAGRELARRVETRLGPGRLAAEIARVERELGEASLAPGGLQRQRERLLEHAALLALRDAHELDPAALLDPGDERPLAPGERSILEDFAGRFEDSLVQLVGSSRPDRGPAIFVALARQRVVALSLAASRLFFLDPFPDAAAVLERGQVAERREEIAAVAELLHVSYRQARRRHLGSGPLGERGYGDLEARAARQGEYRRGAEQGAPVREVDGALVPRRSRALVPPSLGPPPSGWAPALAAARRRVRDREQAIRARYPYDLFSENCVTVLARTLGDALGGPPGVRQAFGGALLPEDALGFVPFVFFERAVERLAPARVERIPSHRERRLAELRRTGSPALVYAREANTLTSTVYRRRGADGSFLLFTDDVLLARPLYGALNLGYAAAQGVLGLLAAPFDRGARAVRASKGMLFSVPELFFVSIRKGSFDAGTLEGGLDPPPGGS